LGISFGGQPVKHRQLAGQVGERIEDPPANSMVSFQFTRSVPSQGTMFVLARGSASQMVRAVSVDSSST
jgi:hypothetical protein